MNAFIKNQFFKSEFVQRSEWRWWTGLLAWAATQFIPMLIAGVIIVVFLISKIPVADVAAHKRPILSVNNLALATIIVHILTILFTIGFSSFKASSWRTKLYITGVANIRASILPIVATAVVIITATAIWEYLFYATLINDGNGLKRLLHSPDTISIAIFSALIGAPLSEEMLFRGFLLPPLAKSRLGFAGAAILTSAIWAGMHLYSWQGSAEVFMIGLGFSFLLWRTGSIIPSILLHMLFNAAFIAVEFATKT